jgi:hypothetical protein
MSAEVLLTEAEWARIAAACPGMPDDARPFISSFISLYRRLPEYKKLAWRYDEAARLARKTAELTDRIERYRSDARMPESLGSAWQESVEGLDELVGLLTLWTERFQETAKRGQGELKASRDPVQMLIRLLHTIMGRLDRSNEVERLVATVLQIADPGLKKRNVGWQIRRAIEQLRLLHQGRGIDDEFFTNVDCDPHFQESIKRLIPDLEAQKK